MAESSKQKWHDATRQILLALDITAEYVALGVKPANKPPTRSGWQDCHSADVDTDRDPSAGFNVADGPFLGRYKDFRSGRSCKFFDFAASRGKFGGDWKQARNYYARKTGVELPNGDEELLSDRLELYDPTPGTLMVYATGKPGVTLQALHDVGTRAARWPKGLTAEKTNHLLVTPMYGSALLDLDPVAWHCVSQNPKFKIRKFQGKGHEDALLKVLTLGEPGLMGEDGLRRLAEAEVVNIVEGITDLYAAQGVLSAWRADEPDSRKHVVISAGGCSYHPKPEWVHHFAGKECRIWFDVGDEKDEGQIGAAVWVSALLPVAKSVRNVQLPAGKNGPQNDLRAWLTDGQRGYPEMDGYAQTFDPIDPSDAAAQLTPNDAILRNLDLMVIGEHEGSQKIEVFSGRTNKAATIFDIDKLSFTKLIQLIGSETAEHFVHDGNEVPPGMYSLKQVRNAIADAACDKLYHESELFGGGIWQRSGQVLIIRAGQVGLLSSDRTKIEVSHVPYFDHAVLDIGQNSKRWVDFSLLGRYLLDAQNQAWCEKVIEEAESIFRRWYWRYPSARKVAVSLVIATWLQTIWEWRPAVFLTGGSDTGKSLLLTNVVAPMFGDLGALMQKTSEAGVRQTIEHHAFILLIDEFEADAHRQRVYDLLRTSSRGGSVVKGSAGHKAVKFRLQHIPWFSAIETGLSRQADLNRFILLELGDIPVEARGKIRLPSRREMRDLGQRLLAVGLRFLPEAQRLAEVLRGEQFEGVPGRVVEGFSVPWAIYSAISGAGDVLATESLRRMFEEWDFTEQAERDEVNVLSEILTSEVQMDGGRRTTVSKLLAESNEPGVIDTLSRVGIRRVDKRTGTNSGVSCLWVCPKVVTKNLLRGGNFSGQAIGQYLKRLKGARSSQQRLGGFEKHSGVEIPMETIDELFHVSGEKMSHTEGATSTIEY